MRTALLSAIETTDEGETRAFLQLGGRNLIDWQLDLARDLGCDRVICIANGPSTGLEDFRGLVEQSGMEFHAIGGPLQLVSLVSADQELVVIGDGVVFDREFLAERFSGERGVAAVPAEPGITVGFERVDAQNAWGGIFIARAQIAAQLADMPSDSDTISLLLRLALQAGTKLVPIESERLDDGSLLLATSGQIIVNREKALLNRSSQPKSWFAPGNALAQIASRQLASNWLARGPILSVATATILIVGALGLTVYLQPIWALAALIGGAFVASLAISLFGLKARLLGVDQPGHLDISFNIMIDLSLMTSVIYPLDAGWKYRLFLIVVLLSAWRLAGLMSTDRFAAFWQDRMILIGFMLAATIFGIVPLLIELLILTALGFCLIRAGRGKITQA